MKILYLDCGMGAAGDMLTGALMELLPDPGAFLEELNGLGIPKVRFWVDNGEKCGIEGTQVTVTVGDITEEEEHCHHHHHSSMKDIGGILAALPVSDRVKGDAMAVYDLIAQAESAVHGVPVREIHFHEVGAMDAVADIVAVCLLMERLAPDRVIASPVHVGSGQVRCAHGILPVPAPATAEILKDVPIYGGQIRGELCTPTGAALLKYFVDEFGPMPALRPEAIGYGMGKKDFPAANCVRAILGSAGEEGERVLELACNIDDMTGEELGFALEALLEAGALEAFTTPAGMKKSRPGQLLTVLCREQDREKIVKALFQYTTTLGIREHICRRHTLSRSFTTVETPYGPVTRKDSQGFGVQRSKYEYEDLARIAKETGLSLEQVRQRLPEETF